MCHRDRTAGNAVNRFASDGLRSMNTPGPANRGAGDASFPGQTVRVAPPLLSLAAHSRSASMTLSGRSDQGIAWIRAIPQASACCDETLRCPSFGPASTDRGPGKRLALARGLLELPGDVAANQIA